MPGEALSGPAPRPSPPWGGPAAPLTVGDVHHGARRQPLPAEHARPGRAWGAVGGSALRADEAEGDGAGAAAGQVVALGTRRVPQRGSGRC